MNIKVFEKKYQNLEKKSSIFQSFENEKNLTTKTDTGKMLM